MGQLARDTWIDLSMAASKTTNYIQSIETIDIPNVLSLIFLFTFFDLLGGQQKGQQNQHLA